MSEKAAYEEDIERLRNGFVTLNRKQYPLQRLPTHILSAIARKCAKWMAGNSRVHSVYREYYGILKSEIESRGELIYAKPWLELREHGGRCFHCDKPALSIVGRRGYCKAHASLGKRLLVMLNHTKQKQRDAIHASVVRHRKFIDNRDLGRQSLHATRGERK